jgi:hypothetical protein
LVGMARPVGLAIRALDDRSASTRALGSGTLDEARENLRLDPGLLAVKAVPEKA